MYVKSKYRSSEVLFALFAPECAATEDHNEPVEDLHEGEEAEPEEEAEQAAQRGDKVNRRHPLTPLILWRKCVYKSSK